MNLGVIQNEPIADYHSSAAVSSTKLMDLYPCPKYFHGRHIVKTIPKPEKKAFAIGNAAHPLILEGPTAYRDRVIIHPEFYLAPESKRANAELVSKPWNWNANVCDEWRKPHDAAGRLIISKDDEQVVYRMASSVIENSDASCLLMGGKPEVTFRKQLGNFAVQCRPDYWQPNGVPALGIFEPVIVDLKTCETIEHFEKHFGSLRYHFRAEFYRLVVRVVLAEMAGVPVEEIPLPRFLFVAVEKFPTHRCEVREPMPDAMDRGNAEVYAALKTLGECLRSNHWPSSRPGILPIGLTSYQERQSIAMTEEILEGAA